MSGVLGSRLLAETLLSLVPASRATIVAYAAMTSAIEGVVGREPCMAVGREA
jgi:hypothetical protein